MPEELQTTFFFFSSGFMCFKMEFGRYFEACLFAQCDSVNILVSDTCLPDAVMAPDALLVIFCSCFRQKKHALL